MRIRVVATLLVCAAGVLPACLPDSDGGQSESNLAGVRAPVLVATLKAANGNVVEFYDLARGVLLSETGAANSTGVLDDHWDLKNRDKLADVWRALAPSTPVPAALAAFQRRLDDPTPPANVVAKSVRGAQAGGQEAPPPAPLDLGAGLQAAQIGCNNGCCDFDWMNAQLNCQHMQDYSWLLMNYGFSFVNANDIANVNALACAAVGTSTFRIQVNGTNSGGGVWTVPEATWRHFAWWECAWPWCGGNMTSSVNDSTHQHLHSYCGFLLYD